MADLVGPGQARLPRTVLDTLEEAGIGGGGVGRDTRRGSPLTEGLAEAVDSLEKVGGRSF